MTNSTVPMSEVMEAFFDGPHATPPSAPEGPVYLGIKNLTEDGHLDLSEVRHISWDNFSKWTKRAEPLPGDLVFTYEASLHRYALIPEGFKGCLGRRVALIRPKSSKVNKRFLLYYFLSPIWRGSLTARINIGSTVDRVPLVDFPNFPIELPTMRIQEKIASVLTAYDELIENNLRRIEILEEMAQAIYREWFVNFRFPGSDSQEAVDVDRGPIPKGWSIGVLSDLVEVDASTPPPAKGAHPFIPMTSLSEGSMLVSEIHRREFESGLTRFLRGDTLFPGINPSLQNGKTTIAGFLSPGQVGLGSTELIPLRSRTGAHEWVYCLARTPQLRDTAIKSMTGASGRQRVRKDTLRHFPLAIPPEATMKEFSDLVRPYFEMAENLRLQLENLRATRDLLLPKLISGEIDVSELDIDTSWLAS